MPDYEDIFRRLLMMAQLRGAYTEASSSNPTVVVEIDKLVLGWLQALSPPKQDD